MDQPFQRQRQLVEQYPDNEMARFSLGKALYDAGQFAEARDQFRVALGKKPEWMAVQILAGRCELSLGNVEGARVAFERARDLAVSQHHEGPLAEMEQALSEL